MGITHTEKFNEVQNKLAVLAKALGHPARIAILEFLLENNTCICGDLVDILPLSQSTISQHLKELKQAGLIKGEIDGPKVCYCINAKGWSESKKLLSHLLNKTPDNCC